MFARVIAILIDRFHVLMTSLTAAAGGTTAGTTTPTPGTTDFATLAPSVAALQASLARAEQHERDQVTSMAQSRTDTRDVEPARADLLVHLRSVAETAATLKTQVPGIGILKAPDGALRAASLITDADTFARNAAIYQQVLIEHGQPADFLTELSDAMTAYRTAIAARGTSLVAQRGATAGIKSEIELGQKIVRQVNAFMQRALRKSPADLAAWNSARRVTLSTASSGAAAPAAAPATPATPAAPAAPAAAAPHTPAA
jgi:hypothetical protein